MSTTPHDDQQPRKHHTSHVGRAVALSLAVLVLIPTGWTGMLSFAFWWDGEPGSDFVGVGALCLVVAGVCLATILGALRSMSRD